MVFERYRFELRGRNREIASYFRYFTNCKKSFQAKFVILSQARTGSVLLGELINCHNNIFCDTEIFLPSRVGKVYLPLIYIEGTSARFTDKVYGFQLKPYQIAETDTQNLDLEEFINCLHQGGWKIVFLKRNNYLKQAISDTVAKKRKKWHDTLENSLEGRKFHISCQDLILRIEKREQAGLQCEKILDYIPHIRVVYEDDLLSANMHQVTAKKVFDFLEVPEIPVHTTLKKTVSDSIIDVVENYPEVVETLQGSKYERFLAD